VDGKINSGIKPEDAQVGKLVASIWQAPHARTGKAVQAGER